MHSQTMYAALGGRALQYHRATVTEDSVTPHCDPGHPRKRMGSRVWSDIGDIPARLSECEACGKPPEAPPKTPAVHNADRKPCSSCAQVAMHLVDGMCRDCAKGGARQEWAKGEAYTGKLQALAAERKQRDPKPAFAQVAASTRGVDLIEEELRKEQRDASEAPAPEPDQAPGDDGAVQPKTCPECGKEAPLLVDFDGIDVCPRCRNRLKAEGIVVEKPGPLEPAPVAVVAAQATLSPAERTALCTVLLPVLRNRAVSVNDEQWELLSSARFKLSGGQ